ncbi:acyl-CoA synthetase [Amycolatopsis methanolica]|uniref:Fatty-acid--CoA ligase n=1 Tax=Amycolatopsis methanolica 239 TaxID=1068978 RepID=A0A076MZK9_AMYME|nr:acyl-CoA synthetase [Amycolatopsis methanolica]AIJ23037.1 fatty-acid--CoA ligase [Amycolatopsis methanolica 239]
MTVDPRSSTVDGVLRRSAARFPDRRALAFADRTWTYRELDDAVSRAATHLQQLGLQHGDRVAAYGRNSDAYAIAFLACARAGFVHVPVNYALTGEELVYLIGQSGSRVVLIDPALASEVDKVQDQLQIEHLVTLRGNDRSLLTIASVDPGPASESAASDTDLVQLLYTSGTTSKPKGAMMTHRALLHEYVSCIVALRLTDTDNPLICMPLYHSAGMYVFFMPYLAVGATITLMEAPDVPEILRRIEEERIGSLFLAPTVWVPLSNHPDLETRDLSSLRKAQYGASIMPVTVLNRLRERYPDLEFYNCFGQSEIGPLATVLGPDEHAERPSSCGRAVLFVQTRVVDENGDDVPPGTPGEILYRSPQLCLGYWNNPDATAEAFDGDWFHSGDLVTADEQGYITVVDRIKDVINTGGVLVASREVEDAIYTHHAVAEVAVVGAPDDKWIEAVTAYVVTKPGHGDVTDRDIIDHVKARLAPFKVPKRVVFIDELPRNQSGKILKRSLRTQHDAAPVS